MDDRRSRYFRWLIRHRYAVLALNLLLVGIVGYGASRVPTDYTMEQFFPGWGPERERYDRYKKAFPKEDLLVSLYWQDARPPGVALYRGMERAAGFFEEVGLRDVRWIGGVDVAEAAVIGGESALDVHPLVEEGKLSNAYVREALLRHRDDDLLLGFLWNADQSVFAIHGTLPQEVMDDDVRRREVEETLEVKLDELRGEGRRLVLNGLPVIRARVPKLLDEDQRRLVSAALVVFLAVLFLFFRHLGQVTLCLVSVVPAYLCTVSLIGLAGKPVTVMTGFIPIIVLVVGGSDIVHLLSRYRRLRPGASNNDAIVGAFGELAGPCFYTSLTTAIGFASLAGTRIQLLIDFGLFTAAAIFLTYAFSMTLLPALLTFYRARRFNDRGLRAAWLERTVGSATSLSLRPSRLVLSGFAVVAFLGVALGSTVRVNSHLVDDLNERSQLLRDLRWIEARGLSVFQVNLHLRQGQDGRPLHDPQSLRWIADFQEYVETEPVVVGSVALPDLLKPLRRATLDGDASQAALPETLEEASQLLLLAEMQEGSLVSDLYLQSEGEAQVMIAVRDAGTHVMLPFLQRVDRYLEVNPPPVGSAVSTGTTRLIQNYTAQVLRNFLPSLAIAVVLIFAVMAWMFRSVWHGLMALVPNFFPLLILLAVMGLADFPLKPATILVFSIAFGLAVDDTIHILGRFRDLTHRGGELERSLPRTVRETGPAILMTSFVVSTGFALLMLSRFEVLFMVGLMTMISAMAAVATDLFVLPTLISVTWRKSAGAVRQVPDADRIRKGASHDGTGLEVTDAA
jgi:predicted RND superfamily exporter protein